MYSNKENGTDSDNLTIRTRKTDMLKKKTLKIIFNFSFFSSHTQDSNLPLWDFEFFLLYETLTKPLGYPGPLIYRYC